MTAVYERNNQQISVGKDTRPLGLEDAVAAVAAGEAAAAAAASCLSPWGVVLKPDSRSVCQQVKKKSPPGSPRPSCSTLTMQSHTI